MLEHVFGSRTRVKLLNLFVQHPDEQFYVRELTRRIQTQINAVRREIQNLVTFGLIVEGSPPDATGEHRKQPGVKRKYFMTNKSFPLFHEIRSLLLKSQIFIERQLDRQILKTGDVRYLAFLGAFLGLRNQPVDVFIVGTVDEQALRRLIEDAGAHMELDINYSCLSPQEFKYRKEIADRFVTAILLAPKTVVVNTLEDKDLAR
ncbi:MAG: hypothetical protein AAB879_03270 [Patescibacteria group bacterium]